MEIFYKIENDGPVYFKPTIYEDERGYFFESFNKKEIENIIGCTDFVQDNESKSDKFVVRGLHFQKEPYAQAKLVRVVNGEALDFIVDIRKGSPTYGKTFMALLTEREHEQFYVPAGFAHGFISLTNDTIFQYKCSNGYNKESEGGISFLSADIDLINDFLSSYLEEDFNLFERYNNGKLKFSEKDTKHPMLKDFDSPFSYKQENG